MLRILVYPPLVKGRLLRRYQRFLADVDIGAGKTVTAFCPNSGSMSGLVEPGTRAMLSESANPERKTRYTLEMLRPRSAWVGVNTLLTNRLAEALLRGGHLHPALRGFDEIRREVKAGDSRLDFLLQKGKKKTYLEVKSVTLRVGDEARFPDAVTTRGRRHLETLMRLKKEGRGAAMLYIVQRGDCQCFAPARDIDPGYARTLKEAKKQGVRIFACGVRVTPEGIYLKGAVPLCRGYTGGD